MTTTEASPDDLAGEVEKALAQEPPKRVTRYWAEVVIALFVVVIIALGVVAGQRTGRTYVLAHDTRKGTPLGPDDLVKARLPELNGALTSKDDIGNLVAADDLAGATALRRKDVLRLQAITTSAIHGGDPISPANVAFQLTAFVPDALTNVSDLGGVTRHSIPAGMIVRKPMLEEDGSVIGTARRELAPFVLLLGDDIAFRKPRFDRAVLVRPIAKGGAVRARDLVAMPADGAEVVGSYRVVCGPIHPLAGTPVLLVSGGKESGEAIEATLLSLQTSGETSTAVVALQRIGALKLAKTEAEPVHLMQATGGSMSDKEPYDAIVVTALQKITKKRADELMPDTALLQLGSTIDITHLGDVLRLEGQKRGVRLGPKLTRSLQGADMEAMTIRDLRDVVAYAGGEDFTPWPKKKKPAEPPPAQSAKKD